MYLPLEEEEDISIIKYTNYVLLYTQFPLTQFCCKGSRMNDQDINSVEIQKQSVALSDTVPIIQPERYQLYLLLKKGQINWGMVVQYLQRLFKNKTGISKLLSIASIFSPFVSHSH
jgi:hypothetical protein